MSDSIVFIDKQKGLSMKRISASDYSEERVVQDLIINYPDLLPSIFSSKITTLTDEYPIEVGSIDVLCVDENGRIYLVITGYSGDDIQATAQLFTQRVYDGKNTGKEMRTVLKTQYQGVMVTNLQIGETIGKEMRGMGGY